MSGPSQQAQFSAFDYGPNSSSDKGTVEYWNYDYPGVLHYTANVTCATISDEDAQFVFQIPEGWPGLSGLYVLAAVRDGGTPGTEGDTWGHTATSDPNQAKAWCESGIPSGIGNYPIVAGNLVVH